MGVFNVLRYMKQNTIDKMQVIQQRRLQGEKMHVADKEPAQLPGSEERFEEV